MDEFICRVFILYLHYTGLSGTNGRFNREDSVDSFWLYAPAIIVIPKVRIGNMCFPQRLVGTGPNKGYFTATAYAPNQRSTLHVYSSTFKHLSFADV